MNEPTKGLGRKDDMGKVRVDLLPAGALIEVGKVLTFGANKYGENNWQGVSRLRYLAALLRHVFAGMRGEVFDSDSGLRHTAHAACCILFMLSHEVGHDNAERLPLPPRVPSGVMPKAPQTVVHVHSEGEDKAVNTIAPTTPAPRHMTSVPVTGTDPDADPSEDSEPIPYRVVPKPRPELLLQEEGSEPPTQRSGRGPETEYVRPGHVVVIPKEYHILHMRYGTLVEDAKADDAVSAWSTLTAYETFGKSGDTISVIKDGHLLYSKVLA